MSTVAIEKPLIDRNVHEIDFNSLDIVGELRKINPRFMESFDKLKGNDQVLWLKSYSISNPVEEALIQHLLDKMTPSKLSQSEESKVRRAMAEEAAKGIEIDSPDKEAEWESRIQEARLKDKAYLEDLKKNRSAQFAGNISEASKKPSGEGLTAIKGLGTKSIEKLLASGVKTADEFNALSTEQLQEIVGPLVASKFSTK